MEWSHVIHQESEQEDGISFAVLVLPCLVLVVKMGDAHQVYKRAKSQQRYSTGLAKGSCR